MERIYGLTATANRDRRVDYRKHPAGGAKIYSLNSTSAGRLGATLAVALIFTGAVSNQVYAGNGGGAGARSFSAATMAQPRLSAPAPQQFSPRSAPVPAPQPAPGTVSAGGGGSGYGQSAGSGYGTTGGGYYPASGYNSGNPGTIYGPPVPAPQPGAQPYPTASGTPGYGQYYAGSGYGPATSGYYPAAAYGAAADYVPSTTPATGCPMAIYASSAYGGASPAPQAPSLYAPSSGASFCNTNSAYSR